ncbi:MAG: 3-octaprenyl-4-hydroxybenzoate carboxy-lyase, partial [Thermoleophilia bacterium]
MPLSPPRLVVAITGASGSIYGIRLLEVLRERGGVETHLVISPAGRRTLAHETDYTVEQVEELADVVYGYRDVGAPLASGSFPTAGMVVCPCSIRTLSALALSLADNLITRAGDVCLKEGRPLVCVVRETPLHLGHLKLMARLAEIG